MAVAPVLALAVDRAVEDLLARRTLLVLERLSFGGLARIAPDAEGVFALLPGLLSLLPVFDELVPLLRRVVHPRVQVSHAASGLLLSWAFLRSKLIDEVVLLFLSQSLIGVLHILFNNLITHCILLLQLSIVLRLCLILQAF